MDQSLIARWRFRLRDSDWVYIDDPVFVEFLRMRPHFIIEEISDHP